MHVLISHNSALELFRSNPQFPSRTPGICDPLAVPTHSIHPRTIGTLRERAGMFRTGAGSLHILVAGRISKSHSPDLVIHNTAMNLLPAGLVRQLEHDLYACGPELCYAQMAYRHPELPLIVLGYELCGSYSHFALPISGFYRRQPLTSRSRIEMSLDMLTQMRGVQPARRALHHVLDGSASPMETVIACALTLPTEVGGQGFAKPLLNHEVVLDDVGRRLTGTGTCRIDAAWPDLRFGLEYDSDMYHPDPAKDRRRREALAHQGWNIYTVDTAQIRRYSELEKTIALVDGMVSRKKRPDPATARRLFSTLMKLTRANLGLEPALFSVPVVRGAIPYYVN